MDFYALARRPYSLAGSDPGVQAHMSASEDAYLVLAGKAEEQELLNCTHSVSWKFGLKLARC